MQQAAAALDARLCAIDTAPGGIGAELASLAAASPPEIFARLSHRLCDDGWIGERLTQLLALARQDPFAMPPARIFSGGSLGGVILAESGPITLSLMLRPFNIPPPRDPTVIFSPGHGMTRIVKSGGARIRRYHVGLSAAERAGEFRAAAAAPLELVADTPLTDGETLYTDQQSESFNLVGGDGDIVMLQLFVQTQSRIPMREYDPASGQLIRVAAAGRAASFRLMGLGLLRAFQRCDAGPLFAAATDDEDFSMRWQAMREWLALDCTAALPRLAAMAESDAHAEVRAAARQTLDLLHERGLPAAAPTDREAAPCPA